MPTHGHTNLPRKSWKLCSQHTSDTEWRGLVQDAALPITGVGRELLDRHGRAALDCGNLRLNRAPRLFDDGNHQIDLSGEMMMDARLTNPKTLGQVGVAEPVVPTVGDQLARFLHELLRGIAH